MPAPTPASSSIAQPKDLDHTVVHQEDSAVDESKHQFAHANEDIEHSQKQTMRRCSIGIKIIGVLMIIGLVPLFAYVIPKYARRSGEDPKDLPFPPAEAVLPDMKGA